MTGLPLVFAAVAATPLLVLFLAGRRRRLSASRLDLSLLRVTEADINRYWCLALISTLLPPAEGPAWFASHVGYLYDLKGREKRRHLLNLVGTFPRQLAVSWCFDAETRRSLAPRRLLGRLSYGGLRCAEVVLGSAGTVIFLALRVDRGQALRLWCCRCVVEERHGDVVRRRTVRLRELPHHERFVAEITRPDPGLAYDFLRGERVLAYPAARSSIPPRGRHRIVTVRVDSRATRRDS
ncbi:hypothetical protein ACIOD2_41365 [Amycolatopsis sp. NPDC088138]|uniref:hypothetical protein n=1 Tax=Amycolatopsis sp. NPDC088138 TaxID=3363938 RepID=UPI0037F4E4CB